MRHQDAFQPPADQLELVEELSLNQPAAIDSKAHRRSLQMHAKVVAQPGNASLRNGRRTTGRTVEIGQQHAKVLVDAPMQVGDVYLVGFDSEILALPESYMLCESCTMKGVTNFEAHLGFFSAISLPTE